MVNNCNYSRIFLRYYKMAKRVNWGLFHQLRHLIIRFISLSNTKPGIKCKRCVFHTFNSLILMCTIILLVLALGFGYSYYFLPIRPIIQEYDIRNLADSTNECNFFEGKWVYDNVTSNPLYNSSTCPFAEKGFDCLSNGRNDQDYLKWRWKPNSCDIINFDVNKILENLRGKRVVFVGDSLSRTQWESMICLLMSGIKDKNSVYEVNGNKITKQIRHLAVRFSSFGLTIEFYRSVFLVQPGLLPKKAPKRVKSTVELDKLDDISDEWVDSDILLFNTGHWWTPTKLFDMGRYFLVGEKLKLGMSMNDAYKTALTTWANWVENSVNTNKTRIFFRTFEPSHWSGKNRLTCTVTKWPLTKTKGGEQSKFSEIIMKVVNNITAPVTVMHVTPMGAYRSDGHVGSWSDNPSVSDCSHWCLPGVPDTWNHILFALM